MSIVSVVINTVCGHTWLPNTFGFQFWLPLPIEGQCRGSIFLHQANGAFVLLAYTGRTRCELGVTVLLLFISSWFSLPHVLRKERRSGAQDSDAKSCFCSASGQASVKLGLLCRWNRIVVFKIWYKDLQKDLGYRCQLQISSFPVTALVVSQMRKYSWIHQTKSCISEECFTQPMYIFVHIWEDGGALSFRKSSLLLASISWSVITLTKHFAFCSGCYIVIKSWLLQ